MRRVAPAAFLVGMVATGVVLAAKPPHYTLPGKVVAIADGDTLTVLDGANARHKIRLAGIDAPEKKQPFGTKAREALADKVFGKAERVDVVDVDRSA
jgi:endonuclease YncB( thermonuclease family)